MFAPRFGSDGLITAILCDYRDNAVLMVAHMNAQTLQMTIESGVASFWSRSRGKVWTKGETSGETLKVHEIKVDCDQDCLLVLVEQQGVGAACHTGRRSCFYRRVTAGNDGIHLEFDGSEPLFDPQSVYKG